MAKGTLGGNVRFLRPAIGRLLRQRSIGKILSIE
jgi:hypothetical protein